MKILKFCFFTLLIIAVTFAAGFSIHEKHINDLKEENKSKITKIRLQKNKKTIHLLGLGDSIIKGYGAPAGDDILTKLKKEFTHSKANVKEENLGIVGLTSQEMLDKINEPYFQENIKNADIILLHIGANDLLKIAKSKGVLKAIQSFGTVKENAENNVEKIVGNITELNPNAMVVLFELYNPVQRSETYYNTASHLMIEWNSIYYTAASRHENVSVIETSDAIPNGSSELLNKDGIHPNEKGYQKLADVAFNQIKTVAYK